MGSENAIFSAAGYGTVNAHVESATHGIEIIGVESQGRERKAFYVSSVVPKSFSVVVLLSGGWALQQAFGDWLRGYCLRVARTAGGVGPMRVYIPSRNFERMGVPKGGIAFGDDRQALLRRMAVNFVGPGSPEDYQGVVASRFELNAVDANSPYFYPAGVQIGGEFDPSPDDRLYDSRNGRRTGVPLR